MKLQVQFAGYEPLDVDTENGIAIFESVPIAEASRALEEAAMGDADESGWIAANIGGEECQIKPIK